MKIQDDFIRRVAGLRTDIIALSRRLRQSARADNETWTGLMVLGAIERGNGTATPAQVAVELELRSSNLAQVLGALEARGLMARVPDTADRRKIRLSLTEAGLRRVEETRGRRDAWLARAIQECLSADEQAQLLAAGELMRRVAQASRVPSDPSD